MAKQTIYRKLAILGAVLGVLLLSGCSGMRLSSMDTLLARTPPGRCVDANAEAGKLYRDEAGNATLNLAAFLKQEKKENKKAGAVLDDFLDCTVADIGPDASDNLKVYRGYVTLAVLTRYAAFNYTGMIGGSADLSFQSYKGIQDDAMSTLARIDFSDKMLRLGSGINEVAQTVVEKDLTANPTLAYMKQIAPTELGNLGKLHDVEKLHRTLSVLMVAAGAEKPTIARARNWFFTIIAAINGSLTSPSSLVDQGLKVVGKSLTLDTFGNVYLDDARQELENMKLHNVAPSGTDWNYWANVIQDSCSRIALASGATSHCAGGWLPPGTPPAVVPPATTHQ